MNDRTDLTNDELKLALIASEQTINRLGQELTDCELRFEQEVLRVRNIKYDLLYIRDMLQGLGDAVHWHPNTRIESAIERINRMLHSEDEDV